MAVSELPGNPNAVWTVKTHTQGRFADSISLVLRGLLVKKLLQTSLFSSTACSSLDGMLELTCNLQYILDMSPMWFYYRSS